MPAKWQRWMKHDIEAWMSSTELWVLSDAAYRAVHNLLMKQFQSEDGMLKSDEAFLVKYSRCNQEKWSAIREEVLGYFTKGGRGKIYHPRCHKEWLEAKRIYETKVESGKLSGGTNGVKTPHMPPHKGTVCPPISPPHIQEQVHIQEQIQKPLAQSTNVLNAVVRIPLVDSSTYDITAEQVAHWATLYPAVDVEQELRKMVGWTESHPRNRKTPRGIKGFVTGWLAREQDKGRVTTERVHREATVGMSKYVTPEIPEEEVLRLRRELGIDSRRANA